MPGGTAGKRLRAELHEGHQVGRYARRTQIRVSGQRTLSARTRRRPTRRRGREPAAGPARAHVPQPGLGGRHHLLAPGRRALVLPSHLARCLLAARGGLALAAQMPTELGSRPWNKP
jgi:hypothetical protein